jgi:hypothetical protein
MSGYIGHGVINRRHFMNWENTFRQRMRMFQPSSVPKHGLAISIKIRPIGGCFHREHSPNAYKLIDEYLDSILKRMGNFGFEEHESGPEILVYLTMSAAVISLASSIINLVTTIINARQKGIQLGNGRRDPLELIVRGFDKEGKLQEEKVLRFDVGDDCRGEVVKKALEGSIKKLFPMNIKKLRRTKVRSI